MRVREVMSPISGSVSVDDRVQTASGTMRALGFDPMPVTDGGRVVGMLSRAEIMQRVAQEGMAGGMTRVRDIMTRTVACCYDDQDVTEAVRALRAGSTGSGADRVPVLDRSERLVGIASLRSLITAAEGVSDGTTAMERVNAVDQLTGWGDDHVDYMSDQSFPASDPPSSDAGATPSPAADEDAS